MYTHAHKHTCAHQHPCLHTHAHRCPTYRHTHAHTHTCTHPAMHTCPHTSIHMHTHAPPHSYTCTHVHTHVCAPTHARLPTHMYSPSLLSVFSAVTLPLSWPPQAVSSYSSSRDHPFVCVFLTPHPGMSSGDEAVLSQSPGPPAPVQPGKWQCPRSQWTRPLVSAPALLLDGACPGCPCGGS